MPETLADITLAEARARDTDARNAWRRHKQACRKCSQLTHNRQQFCPDGWAIATEMTSAARALTAAKGAAVPGQDGLF